MKSTQKNLKLAISAFVEEIDSDFGGTLSKDLKSFMVAHLTDFVGKATTKFIRGQAEHADSDFFNIDHLLELDMENLDTFWYLRGYLHARRKRK